MRFLVYGSLNGADGNWIVEADSIESAKASLESRGHTVTGVVVADNSPIQVFDIYASAGGYENWRRNLSNDCRVTTDIIFGIICGGAILLAIWWAVGIVMPSSMEIRAREFLRR